MSNSHPKNPSCQLCVPNQDLITACETLTAAWDADEDSKEIDWEDPTVAVDLASAALSKLGPIKIS